ncbi:MAG: glycosyltransferase family 39 protein [Planctomycetota bacterium]
MAGGEEAPGQLTAAASGSGWRWRVALLLLLATQLGLLIGLAVETPFTSDEVHYLGGGKLIRASLSWPSEETYKHGPLFYFSHQLAAVLGVTFEPVDDYRPWGRLGTVAFSLMTSLLLVGIARRAAGRAVALIALALFATNPLALGHGCLITADMPLAACCLLTLLLAWRYFEEPGLKRLLALGAGLALALATKYVAVLLVPALLGAALLLAALGFRPRLWISRTPGPRWRGFADLLPAAVLLAVTSLVVLHACYLFRAGCFDPATPPLKPESTVARAMDLLPPLGWCLRLLPAPFVAGVDYQLGAGTGYLTLCLNQVCTGHWAYYVVAFLTKMPLAMLVALGLAPFLRGPRWPVKLTTLLWFVGLVPLAYLSLFASLQLGLRYQLALLPILCLVAARPLAWLWARGGGLRAVPIALLLWAALSSLQSWPDYIGYFHELARSRPYLLFSDSNLDWHGNRRDHPHEHVLSGRHPDAERVQWASGPRLGKVFAYGLDLWPQERPEFGPVRHWLRRFHPVDREGAWFAFEVNRADYQDHIEAGDPDAARDLAVALLARNQGNDRSEALRLAATLPGTAGDGVRDQANRLSDKNTPAAVILDGWTALGRHDQVLADPRADSRRRAFAHYARHEWQRCRQLLEALAAQRPLYPDEAVRLIRACFHLGDVDGTLAALEHFKPPAGSPAAQQLEAFRAELRQFERHLRLLGQR